MFYIYLYCDDKYERSTAIQYGYWSGSSYIRGENVFPIVADGSNTKERKKYKTLNRAIRSGHIAIEKYTYCCGFDIEDENSNIVYKSFKDEKEDKSMHRKDNNEVLKSTSKVSTPTLDRILEIQEYSELCGEFLDWFLCKYAVFERKQKRESPFVNAYGAGDYINKEKLLAEFFEIDLEEAEREKQSIIESLR